MAHEQGHSHRHTGILGKHGAKGHALHLHAQQAHQQQARHDVGHILHNGHEHGYASVLHAYEPARQPVERQHGGRAPNADAIVGGHQRSDIGRGTYQRHHQPQQWALKHQQQQSQRQRHGKRPHKQTHHLGEVTAAKGLRRCAAGAHAQKPEYPVDKVEHHCPNGYRAYIDGVAQMAGYGHIDKAKQRNGDV